MCRNKINNLAYQKNELIREKFTPAKITYNLCFYKCWISDADSKRRAYLLIKQLGQSFSQLETGQCPW